MAATRLFDLFAAQLGDSPAGATPTQLVGPRQLRLSHGHPRIVASNDGLAGVAAQDQGPWGCRGSLSCGDVSTFMAVLAAFEGATDALRALMAEGKEVGAATVTDILLARARLVGARLACRNNDYAQVDYDLRSSCAPASDSQDDELSFTEAQAKTATIGSGLRTYRIVSATHAAVQAEACLGFDLNVAGQAVATHGDDDFGETVDVSGYDVSGTVTFQDFDVDTLLAMTQKLIAAAEASLVLVLKQQGGGANTTLTLANTRFFETSDALAARQYGTAALGFGCAGLSGTTPYALATGANKIITMA